MKDLNVIFILFQTPSGSYVNSTSYDSSTGRYLLNVHTGGQYTCTFTQQGASDLCFNTVPEASISLDDVEVTILSVACFFLQIVQ